MTDHFQTVLAKHISRRQFLKKSILAASVATSGCSSLSLYSTNKSTIANNEHFHFTEIEHGFGHSHQVPQGYHADVLIKWGDPLFSNAPAFDVNQQSPVSQEQQFGFNNDYIGYLPMPKTEEGQQARALLCVNHEYSLPRMMFPEISGDNPTPLTATHVQIEQSSVGNSIIEVIKTAGSWKPVIHSTYNRRITARTTSMQATGPAAGTPRMRTKADPSGRKIIGTLMNCAGGMTPWGTYLTCEENFNNVFTGTLPAKHKEYDSYTRYGINGRNEGWGVLDARFNLHSEPNEPNRFGWVVEIDPLDPNSTPKKRTALGRLKHEGAETVLTKDGRVVVYMGDDAYSEYLYKFISRDQVNTTDKKANTDILDHGVLYVAKFSDDGNVDWLPLVYGQGPLNEENQFFSQADVCINTRLAADALGATPMDRPEDVVPNPKNGSVYVMLTNNTQRKPNKLNAANPRPHNAYGQIVEIIEPNSNFASKQSQWNMLVLAGDPADPKVGASWHPDISPNGWFACPDNGVIDHKGRLWVGTDQGDVAYKTGTNDGLWAMETEGPLKGKGKMFFRCPDGAEVTGPVFADDGKALFIALQHPGVGSAAKGNDTLHNPITRWPDFSPNIPPRPGIVVVQKDDGGEIA